MQPGKLLIDERMGGSTVEQGCGLIFLRGVGCSRTERTNWPWCSGWGIRVMPRYAGSDLGAGSACCRANCRSCSLASIRVAQATSWARVWGLSMVHSASLR